MPSFVKRNVPLAQYSTLGVGGPADYFATITHNQVTSEILLGLEASLLDVYEFARDNGIDVFVLGRGSNVLFGDKGFRGLVLQIKTDKICFVDGENKNELWADAGVLISELVHFGNGGFSGFEFLAGLPGTVGGATYGNAGCYGGQFWDVVDEVEFFDGEYIQSIKKDASMFGYRWSIFKDHPNWIILAVRLEVKLLGKKVVASKTRSVKKQRLASQPKARSIGCIFRNPEDCNPKASAGRLIELAGLKNLSVGGAQISEEHANFFVNKGCARASDFIELIQIAKGRILERFNVQLKEEIIRVGEF